MPRPNTRDLGLAIRDMIEEQSLCTYKVDDDGEMVETGHFQVDFVDVGGAVDGAVTVWCSAENGIEQSFVLSISPLGKEDRP